MADHVDVGTASVGLTREPDLDELRRRFVAACGLELPSDHPRKPRSSMTIGRERAILPRELTQGLKALAAILGARFEATLLAALGTFLYRYAGYARPVVGFVPDHPERLLPLAFAFAPESTFAAVVQEVERELGRDGAQGLPLELLRGDSAVDRELPRVLFAGLGPPNGPPIPGRNTTTEPYDLALVTEAHETEVFTTFEFDAALFERSTIERMLGYFQTLLRAGVSAPDARVRGLAMLPPAERDLLLKGWNRTRRPYPAVCVHDLVAARAAVSPDAVAASYGEDHLTYAELEARSNQLGHILQALEVGPEVAVGVSAEPSLDLLVGLLAVLKSGGAFVPVDPHLPAEQQGYMLADAEVRALLTRASIGGGCAPDGVKVLFLDRDREWIAAAASEPPPADATPQTLAYVSYGSDDKGVEVTHGSLVNLLTAMAKRPGIRAEDVLAAVPALSSQTAGLEVFLPLSVGARLVVCSEEVAGDSKRFASLLEKANVTIAVSKPSTWRSLLDTGWSGQPGLRLLCPNEAMASRLEEALLRHGVELWNLYGAAEATMCSALLRVEEPATGAIGRPIANTALYILDEELEPVPIGLTGDLYIGGHGLARGYHNRPDETAARFVHHPFDRRPEARLFKTGDRARYRADGMIQLLGTTEGDPLPGPSEDVYPALRTRLDQTLAALWPRRRG